MMALIYKTMKQERKNQEGNIVYILNIRRIHALFAISHSWWLIFVTLDGAIVQLGYSVNNSALVRIKARNT